MDKHLEAQAAAAENRDSADNALPSYTPLGTASSVTEQTEHTYQLEDAKGRPWIWLIVKSRAKDKKTWPLFYEKDVIQGTVEVDFDKTDGAKGVTIGVRIRYMARPCLQYVQRLTNEHDSDHWGSYRRRTLGGGAGLPHCHSGPYKWQWKVRRKVQGKAILAILTLITDNRDSGC